MLKRSSIPRQPSKPQRDCMRKKHQYNFVAYLWRHEIIDIFASSQDANQMELGLEYKEDGQVFPIEIRAIEP
nr:hypothetical transcript [Hymenolepis microstoma]